MRSGVLVALLDLAADVHQERPVGGVDDLGPVDAVHRAHDVVAVRLAAGVDRDVAHRVAVGELDEVDRADLRAGLADRAGDPAEHAGPVGQAHPQDQRVLRLRGLGLRHPRYLREPFASTSTMRTREEKEPSRPWASSSSRRAGRPRS